MRTKEKELKELKEYLEYLYHNITKPARQRSNMRKKINYIADRIVVLEKELSK